MSQHGISRSSHLVRSNPYYLVRQASDARCANEENGWQIVAVPSTFIQLWKPLNRNHLVCYLLPLCNGKNINFPLSHYELGGGGERLEEWQRKDRQLIYCTYLKLQTGVLPHLANGNLFGKILYIPNADHLRFPSSPPIIFLIVSLFVPRNLPHIDVSQEAYIFGRIFSIILWSLFPYIFTDLAYRGDSQFFLGFSHTLSMSRVPPMAARACFCFFLAVFFAGLARSQGNKFDVGGKDGWVVDPSESYIHWAERTRFQVNDTICKLFSLFSSLFLLVLSFNNS